MATKVEPLSFEQARRELSKLTASLNTNRIDMDAWCNGVHDVIARYQEGARARLFDAADNAASTLPRPADAMHADAADGGVVLADTHRVDSRYVQGHAA